MSGTTAWETFLASCLALRSNPILSFFIFWPLKFLSVLTFFSSLPFSHWHEPVIDFCYYLYYRSRFRIRKSDGCKKRKTDIRCQNCFRQFWLDWGTWSMSKNAKPQRNYVHREQYQCVCTSLLVAEVWRGATQSIVLMCGELNDVDYRGERSINAMTNYIN